MSTTTGAPRVPASPLTIRKLVPFVSTPVTVGITIIPPALIFEAPVGLMWPKTALLASVVAIDPPALVVSAPVIARVLAPRLNPEV